MVSKIKITKEKMKLEQLFLLEDIIEEGIVYFKNSNKIKKLITTIEEKTQRIEEEDKRKIINSLLNKLENLKNKFEILEKAYYSTKDKKTLKKEYKEVQKEFSDLIELGTKEQIKSLLKNIGVYGVMVASMIVPYKFINILTSKYGETNDEGVKNLNPFAKAGVFFGTSTLFNLLHPSKIIEKKINPNVVEKTLEATKGRSIK